MTHGLWCDVLRQARDEISDVINNSRKCERSHVLNRKLTCSARHLESPCNTENMPGISDPAISADALEEAAKEVEKLLTADAQYAELSGKLKVNSNSM